MRQRKQAEVGSLDSLLDTMTNVVGILVVVVAVTQINVADTVRQIMLLQNLRGLELQTAKEAYKQQQRIEAKLDKISEHWGSLDSYMVMPDNITSEDIKRLIPDLEFVAEDPSILPDRRDIPTLTKVMELEIQLAELQRVLELHKSALDFHHVGEAEEPAKVTLPDLRPVNGLKPIFFMCREHTVYPFDLDGLVEIFEDQVRKLLEQPVGVLEIKRADFPRLELHFANRTVGDSWIRMRLKNLKDTLLLSFEPRQSQQGQTLNRLDDPTLPFLRRLRAADPQKVFVRFLVWGDSFREYLKAREMAEEAGLKAGWVPYSQDEPLMIQIRGEGQSRRNAEEVID